MKRAFLALLALGFGWLAYSLMHEDRARYRITYTIETPSGEKSGSHVLETWRGGCGRVVGGYSFGLRGEAAVIDLGEGKTIIALLAMGPKGEAVDLPRELPNHIYREELRRLCSSWYPLAPCEARDFNRVTFSAHWLKPLLIPTLISLGNLNGQVAAKTLDAQERGMTT
jgi:hypothetical protein